MALEHAPRYRAAEEAMARMEALGAFALTEPEHGSDSVALETRVRRDGDEWVLDGHKKWIGNGSIADVVVVWARDVAVARARFPIGQSIPAGRRAAACRRYVVRNLCKTIGPVSFRSSRS